MERGVKMTKTTPLMITAVFLLVGCGPASSTSPVTATAGTSPQADRPPEDTGNPLGDIALKDIEGRTVPLSEYLSGKAALVSFFATYCEGCKQKTIDHQLLYDKFKDKGFVVMAISVDEPETSGQVRTFVKSRNLTFPIFLDVDFEAVNLLNPRRTLPYSLIMDRGGKILWTHEGYVPGDDRLIEQHVAEVVAGLTEPGAQDR